MATKFAFPDEVLSLLLTHDDSSRRLALLLKDYEFPKTAQSEVAQGLLQFTDEWHVAAKEHAYEFVDPKHHPYLRELVELARNVHTDYVVSRLEGFLREGAIRKTVTTALDYLQTGEWNEIEHLFTNYTRQRVTTFDAGIRLRGDALRSVLGEDLNELTYGMGIKPLDDARVGPGPKTLLLFIAPPKRGKSWFLIHQGVQGIRERRVVVHITLEMSDRKVARRYVQNLLSLTKRQVDEIDVTQLDLDNLGRLQGFSFDKVKRPAISLDAFDKANNLLARSKLIIKEFPMRSITVEDLRAYLDMLEDTEQLVPDELILDYADLMKVDANNLRIDTGVLFQGLRGIAQERGIALITASQSGRKTANSTWVREDDVAEDWSKIMTADTVLTYSQTPDERKLGLARIFVSNARDEQDKWALVVSQSYVMGQFALDAVRMSEDVYWGIVSQVLGKDEKKEEE